MSSSKFNNKCIKNKICINKNKNMEFCFNRLSCNVIHYNNNDTDTDDNTDNDTVTDSIRLI